MNDFKPTRINKHINLTTKNFVFLSGAKTDLMILAGYNANYSELINLAIDQLNKSLGSDDLERFEQLDKRIKEFKNSEIGGQ